MYNLHFTAEGHKLKASNPNFVAMDSKGYVGAVFHFDNEWNGMLKTVQFRLGSSKYFVVLKDDACVVPYQMLKGRSFCVSVCGVGVDKMINSLEFNANIQDIYSNEVIIPVEQGGFDTRAGALMPSAEVYAHLAEGLVDCTNHANDAYNRSPASIYMTDDNEIMIVLRDGTVIKTGRLFDLVDNYISFYELARLEDRLNMPHPTGPTIGVEITYEEVTELMERLEENDG